VITLDLFTCGPSPLLPLLPTIKKLFGVPRTPAVPGTAVESPHMQWAHKKRGFRNHEDGASAEATELNQFLLGWFEFDYKELVVSQETAYQTVEIYDVLSRRLRDLKAYETSLADPSSYEGRHKDLFRPDRILYLDGVSQSRFYGDASYHEALVHPVMVAHRHPKRVAIIGGGEGATLREVLKHDTVEKVVMVEIDEEMVKLSRQYLPEWSDCSKLVGSPKSCFEHPKAEVYYMDAIAWFMDRFGDAATLDASQKFDVIIMDALYVFCLSYRLFLVQRARS
jgi:Spermine/spermidine synthase domain